MDRKSAGDAVTFRIFSRVAGRRNLTTQEQIKIFNISSEANIVIILSSSSAISRIYPLIYLLSLKPLKIFLHP